ncbi:hypothetical protein [Nocardiopsis sp. MG754419]|uniref:hypothetical protein n=1 Tax=Nocardiopsis sp. MG754419 TaxID=2259865 RepID=UPI001BAD01D9|nr:hypothetical protein [Nocardiopsis sp. MG754419]MBR8742761.1 hypothetical protein [Nocardiopsis sp. MG754419]
MPLYREFTKTRSQKLPPGEWRSLRFDVDHEGREGGFYALVGQDEPHGAVYDVSVGIVLDGVDPGAEVQLRASEYVKAQDDWVVARERPIDSPVHADGRAHFTYSWKGFLQPGRRVRIRVVQYGRSHAVILGAEATAVFWPEGGIDAGPEYPGSAHVPGPPGPAPAPYGWREPYPPYPPVEGHQRPFPPEGPAPGTGDPYGPR